MADVKKQRRTPGSYYLPRAKGDPQLFRGCLRIRGGVVWSCPHRYDHGMFAHMDSLRGSQGHATSAEARACASAYLKANPEVGLES